MGSFESLRYRDYRLLWTGAVLSNIGTWMATVALSWYVLLLTRSAFWVSFVTFANFLPVVLSPIAGALTDRMDRKRILVYAQTFMMVDAVVLAALATVDRAGLVAVLALTFGQGLGFALNGPAWIAFIPSLVPPGAMVNAVALNSAQFNLARVIGPAVAGALIAASGVDVVLWMNALSFGAVLVALSLIRTPSVPAGERRSVTELVVGGFRYAWRHRWVRTLVATIAVLSLFGAPVSALLPVFAARVFGLGAGGYGALAAAVGVGSVLGALVLGRAGGRPSPGMIATALVVLAGALVAFGLVRAYPAGVGLLVVFGAAFLMVVAGSNSSIMLEADERVRGRVVSIWMLAFGAFFPAGSVLAGAVAEVLGPGPTAVIGGVACGLWGAGLLWRFRGPAAQPGVAAVEPAP